MTNLLTGIALATNILATNHVEFRTNIFERDHPTNTLYIYNRVNMNLIPFLMIRETNITRIETLEYNWRGERVVLQSVESNIFSVRAVFHLDWCKGEWERIP